MRRRSYSAEYKLKVLEYAKENGVDKAAREFNIAERSIRRWKKEKNVLQVSKKSRRAFRGRSPKYPQIEAKLTEWIKKERKDKRQVSTVAIARKARLIAQKETIDDFKASDRWVNAFMRRNLFSVRAVTSVGQKTPGDYMDVIAKFRQFYNKIRKDIRLVNIGNMDEVPVTFDLPRRYTVDTVGSQDVSITTTGSEKQSCTVVLSVTADGGKCKPMIIFKRKTVPKNINVDGVVVIANENGWMNEDIFCDWVEKCWNRRRCASLLDNTNSLLIMDSARCHITEKAKNYIQQYSKIAVITGGMTKYLQPLDISVNKSFKEHLKQQWEEWMHAVDSHTYTKSGRLRRAPYEEVVRWVKNSFDLVTGACIKNGFNKAYDKEIDIQEIEQLMEDIHI